METIVKSKEFVKEFPESMKRLDSSNFLSRKDVQIQKMFKVDTLKAKGANPISPSPNSKRINQVSDAAKFVQVKMQIEKYLEQLGLVDINRHSPKKLKELGESALFKQKKKLDHWSVQKKLRMGYDLA